MDGTEDEILWEETEDVPTTPVDDEEEDEGEGVYADHLTSVAELVWQQRWQFRKLRKARGVIFVPSTPQIPSLVTKFSKMVVFSSSDPSKLFGVSLVF